MKLLPLIFLLLFGNICTAKKHIIFLHNKFLETHTVKEAHLKYGKVQLNEIKHKFKKAGFSILINKRNSSVKSDSAVNQVIHQIDSIHKINSKDTITVIGTSKGGYLAQMVSSKLKNPKINFVFIGCFQESDIKEYPNINFCGNILTIFEKTDPFGVSAIKRKQTSKLPIPNFKEVELNTGLNHGFLFQALDTWINPCIKWGSNNYQ
jgi:hypothetical protein